MLPAMLHAWQVPAHALLQQTLSTQNPDKQSVPTAHVAPWSNLHALAPLQDPLVHSPSGSVAVMMGPQVPLVPWPFNASEHALHIPVQFVSQQTPSTQKPEMQSVGKVQVAPLSDLHAPKPSHDWLVPEHVPMSSWLAATFEHVPMLPAMLHAWQVLAQLLLQHKPSAQTPLKQPDPPPPGQV